MRRFVVVFISAVIAVATGGALPANATTVEKTFTYSIATKGTVGQSADGFAASVAAIYADSRGWSLGGTVQFTRVASGGDFTLWLTQASLVPSFSDACSSEWSCRVGRNIAVNNDRWMLGTKLTSEYGMSVLDYRHLLVNHETGHFLGLEHSSCSGPGNPANVMQQQSKGGEDLGACVPNSWPTSAEKSNVGKKLGVSIAPATPTWVGVAMKASNDGYWTASNGGGVLAYGNAVFKGSMSDAKLAKPVVGIASHPDGEGYWLVASDGGIFAFGSAKFFGGMGGKPLNKPIVGMVSTNTGNGYWLVASDGGVFAYGDAAFHGSMGGETLNKPMVGITRSASGNGYRTVASDGGIFAFGDAGFHGSMGGVKLNQPVTGMTATASGYGYLMVAKDGGVFAFGDAQFFGSNGANPSSVAVSGIAERTDDLGYVMVDESGKVNAFGSAVAY